MDNKQLIVAATATLEAAVARWEKEGPCDESVKFRLHVAQVEAMVSIAQSLAVLAEHADELARRAGD